MTATIAILSENSCEAWWAAARKAKSAPRELRPLLNGKATAIEVDTDRARELRAWCATLPGWDTERAPLSFGGLRGRPPSARRSEGGTRVTVWLAADEAIALQALADARGQTLADVLRACALVDAKREATREAVDTGDAPAEPVAAEAVAAGDHVYTDVTHVPPRGKAARVVAVHREHDVWRLELASGAPMFVAAGAEIWRRPRRAP